MAKVKNAVLVYFKNDNAVQCNQSILCAVRGNFTSIYLYNTFIVHHTGGGEVLNMNQRYV